MSLSLSRKNAWVLTILSLAQFMGVLDFSIVNVALPAIKNEFHLAQADLQWIVSVYALLFGGFLLVGGRATDLFERKRVFIIGLLFFTLSSLVGGLANSQLMILLARGFQGFGAAIMTPASLAILTTSFEEGPARNKALGIFSSVASIGFALGAVLGGILTSTLSWRWIFFVNIPMGAIAVIGALLILPQSRSNQRSKLDLLGAIFGTATISALVMTLSSIGGDLFFTLGFMAVTIVLGLLFVLIEQRVSSPLVPLSIFRNRQLTGANFIGMFNYAIATLLGFVLTLYLQDVLKLTPLLTGLIFLPAGFGGIFGSQFAGFVLRRVGLKGTAITGALILGLSMVPMLFITPTSGVPLVLIGYIISGIGIVTTVVASTIAATANIPTEEQGLAAGLINTSGQLGSAIGISVASVVAGFVLGALGNSEGPALTFSNQMGLVAGIVISALIVLIALLGFQKKQQGVESEEHLEATPVVL